MAEEEKNPYIGERRLTRIEEKIDKLSEGMITIARAEEKINAMESDRKIQITRLNRFSEKLDIIERKVIDASKTIEVLNKLFWIACMAIAAAVATNYWQNWN